MDEPSDCQCPNCGHWGRRDILCEYCGDDRYMVIHDHALNSNEDTKPPHCTSRLVKKVKLTKEEDEDYSSIDYQQCRVCGWYSTDNPCHACRHLCKPTVTPMKIKPDN